MNLLFFGTYDAALHPRVAVLRDGLRASGAEVRECNHPLGLSTADKVDMLQHPWKVPLLAVKQVGAWRRIIAESLRLRRQGIRPDAIVVGYLGHFDVHLARLLYPMTTIVLDHLIGAASTAADRGLSTNLKSRVLTTIDRSALRAAHLVVVDTEEHLAALPPSAQAKAIVTSVGAPASWFHHIEPRSDQPLSVVFFGLFTPLQGAPVIGSAIASLSDTDIHFTMIGSGQDLETTQRASAGNDNVTWIPWVEPAQLSAEVAQHDICLGIFGTGPKALAVVPNKVFQGAAAGCAIITSDTTAQRRVLGDAAVYVPPGDSLALASSLRRFANDRAALQGLRSRSTQLAATSFAPEAIVQQLSVRIARLAGLQQEQ